MGRERKPQTDFWPVGGGEVGTYLRSQDWASTPLGPVENWPQRLRAAVDLILHTPAAMAIGWGPEGLLFCNDAFICIAGTRHPEILGRPLKEAWPELAEFSGRMLQVALSGETLSLRDEPFTLLRKGVPEQVTLDVDCSPLFDESGSPAGLLAVLKNTTEATRAQAALRVNEARQAFLLKLSDVLRPITDPIEVQGEAARLLGEHLEANRTLYAEHTGDELIVHRDYVHAVPSMAGRYPMAAFGQEFIAAHQRGESCTVNDVATDSRLDDSARSTFAAVNVASFTGVGLIKNGQLVASFGAHSATPRQWTPEEVDLVRAVAERTWEAVERARAERALHVSEDKYRSLFNLIDEGFCIFELLFDANGQAVDCRFLETNPAFAKQTGLVGAAGKTIRGLVPKPDARWLEIFGKIALTGLPVRLENYSSTLGRYYDVYAFRIGVPEQRRVAVLFNDISERKRREANLAFLAKLAEDLSRLSSAEEVMRAVGQKMGAHLKIASCVLAEVDEAQDTVTVGYRWSAAHTQPDGVGVYRLSEFVSEEVRESARAAKAIVIRNASTDPRTPAGPRAACDIQAYVIVPFHRDGEWKYLFTVGDSAPRDWRADEVELIHEVANRVAPRIARARAEEALRASEEEYRALFNSIEDGFALCEIVRDAQGHAIDFRHLELNPAFERQTGISRDAAVGRLVSEVLPGLEKWWLATFAHVVEANEPIHFERFAEPLDRWYRVSAYPRGGDRFAVLYDDITEGKQAEEALRESEERFRALVTATSDVVYRINPDWTEIHYLRGRDFVADTERPSGTWLQKYIHPDDQAHVTEVINEAIRTKSTFELEHRVLRVDGSLGWTFSRAVPLLNARSEITEWFGAASDITWRKEAEAALRASESRERARAAELSAVLQAAPVALFIAQDPECRNMVGSPMTYEMLHLPPGANVSKTAPEGQQPTNFRIMRDGREIPPRDLPPQKAAATGQAVRNYEFDLIFEDGTRRNILGDAVPLFDEQGRPRGSVGAFVDITDRTRHEERLCQAQKLESIGVLAGGVAHDFNNLLTTIIGNAGMALNQVSAGAAELIREVIDSAERAANLIRQLLEYSGKGQFIARDLNVSEAVNEIRGLVESSVPKSVNLAVTVQRRLPMLRMDPRQFQQIFMNLIINAGEAIEVGKAGEITAAISMAVIDRSFIGATGEALAPGRYVCIEVSDTGCGIDQEKKSKIFDPFFSTKFLGRGLGLAAVAGIVRSLKGGITIESAVGRGSTFRVFLPAGEKYAPDTGEGSGPHQGAVRRSGG